MQTTEEYCLLFNSITDSVIELEKIVAMLKDAQVRAEALLIDDEKNKDEKQVLFQRETVKGTG